MDEALLMNYVDHKFKIKFWTVIEMKLPLIQSGVCLNGFEVPDLEDGVTTLTNFKFGLFF